MGVQVIERDGKPEYAVLPWEEYQALLLAAGQQSVQEQSAGVPAADARFSLARVRELRESCGMSVEQLARAVGISAPYLGMIEAGERTPDGAIERALARVLARQGAEP